MEPPPAEGVVDSEGPAVVESEEELVAYESADPLAPL